MKNILFSFLWIIANSSQAQKVDLDPFKFNLEYRDLPHDIFDSSLKSFTPIIQLTPFTKEHISEEVVASKLLIHGYERNNSNADIQFVFYMSDITILEFDILETVTESKNRDGTINKKYSYFGVLKYRLSAIAYLRNKAGKDLVRRTDLILNNPLQPLIWKSKEFNTSSAASQYMKDNIEIINGNLLRENLDKAIVDANHWANYCIGFPLKKDNVQLWLLDSKNHPEYENMHKRWNSLKISLQEITAVSINEDIKSAIIEAIKYFDNIKLTYNSQEKADKKMRYAAFYNNAQLYLILDKPEEAKKEAEGLIVNDYDAKDGERIRKQAEGLSELFKKHDIYTRHFEAMQRPYRR
ncbi:MAG: hypothetical protein ACK5FT_08165 [Sphingomonadales bacterium]|jgi:hypothetical protein